MNLVGGIATLSITVIQQWGACLNRGMQGSSDPRGGDR